MKQQHLHLGLVLALATMLALAVSRFDDSHGQSQSKAALAVQAVPALHAIPKAARFVVTLDLRERNAEKLRELLFNTEHDFSGLGRLTDICGYDPSSSIQTLAVAAFAPPPEPSAEPAFGIVASGSFDAKKFARCAEEVVRSRGGTPEVRTASAVTLIRDVSAEDGAEIAVLNNGVALVAKHRQLRQMLAVLDGNAPNLMENPIHQSLRLALGPDATALATLQFDPGWLARLFQQKGVERSPLNALEAAAMSLNLGNRIELKARLRCKQVDGCTRLKKFLEDLRRELAPALQGQFASASLSEIPLVQQRSELSSSWTLSPRAFASLLGRMTGPTKPRDKPLKPAAPAPNAAPDSVIPAPP